ncbi:MAG: glycerate kinase [Anaerolineae bacterium]
MKLRLGHGPPPSPGPAARLLEILGVAMQAVDPAALVASHLRLDGEQLHAGPVTVDLGAVDRVFLVAAGKAAATMAAAAERILGPRLSGGVAVTARGGGIHRLERCTLHEGGHPLPDPSSLLAARQMARMLEGLTERDLVIALISGGSSALLELPAGRLNLVDLQTATASLLASGAAIHEINTVRRHLSRLKGGGLARLAAPARLVALVLSDVVGSPLDAIGSGPTVPDPTTYADAAAVIARYGLWSSLPASISEHLRTGMSGRIAETAKQGEPCFARSATALIGDNALAARAAGEAAAALGYGVLHLGSRFQGEARELGRIMASLGQAVAAEGLPLAAPACLIAGGESTVSLKRLGGVGGRNQELALAAAIALDDPRWAGISLASFGTDGVDGATDAAGAIVDGTTAARARTMGLDPQQALAGHDSGRFFQTLGEAIVSGPTGTNVNDLMVLLVDGTAAG